LRLRFAEGELTVSAQTQDIGEAHESLPIDYAGEPLEIGFNPDFLRDGLEAVAGETVRIKLINPLRPAVLSAPDASFWYLIMPIRLPD
jgi:DNA polymerase III subunit beta